MNNINLSKYSGYGCGGRAKTFIEIENEVELKDAVKDFKKKNIEFCVLGRGYNTLISDRGVDFPILKLGGEFNKIDVKEDMIKAGAGAGLEMLIRESLNKELTGIEFLAGIPGSVGGAVFSNAGAFGTSIGKKIVRVKILNYQTVDYEIRKKNQLNFEYRRFNLNKNDIITECVLKLKRDIKSNIIKLIEENIRKKQKKQPTELKSCGCVFKNPDKDNRSAGELIEKAGLAGLKIGNAEISKLHANFIINKGNASSSDIWELIKTVRNKVKQKYNKDLVLEIDLLGEGFNT
ncbi:MAG: UDP-N-acetylmuramate dehydrogenase [Elusimicrobiota bacterium]